jgi:hypothetical protein
MKSIHNMNCVNMCPCLFFITRFVYLYKTGVNVGFNGREMSERYIITRNCIISYLVENTGYIHEVCVVSNPEYIVHLSQRLGETSHRKHTKPELRKMKAKVWLGTPG